MADDAPSLAPPSRSASPGPPPDDARLVDAHPVLSDARRDVTAAAPWGPDAAFVALDGGCVVLLRRGGEPSAARAAERGGVEPAAPWRVASVHASVSTKRVLQMEVLGGEARGGEERREGWLDRAPTRPPLFLQADPDGLGCLLALTEDGVSALRLPTLAMAAQADRTRGAARFAWRRPWLAAARGRKVILLKHDGREFVPVRDVGLPRSVAALAWAGDAVLLAGAAGGAWWAVDVGADAASAPREVSPAPALAPGAKPAPAAGASAGPAAAALASAGAALLVAADGKPPRLGGRLAWRGVGAPAAVAAAGVPPVVAACLPGGVEVRLLHPDLSPLPSQTLPLACMAVASCGGGGEGSPLLVAGGGRVVALAPRPCPALAADAAAAGRHADAVVLAGLTPDAGRREAALRVARRGLAASLFAGGDFDGALAQLGMQAGAGSDGDGDGALLSLLRLFPSLAPPELLEGLDDGDEPAATGPPPPEPSGAAYERAVAALLPYLMSFRGRLAARERTSADGAADAPSPPPPTPLAVAVDTAILHAMLVGPDTGAALRFASSPNAASARHGEAALRAVGRFAELVALLRAAGRHEDGLDLLKALSTAPTSLPTPPTGAAADLCGVTGAWAAARYLRAVGGARPDLVHAHARWIVAADDDAGVGLLLELEPPPSPDAALAVLRAAAPALRAPYLEAAIAAGIAPAERWHGELAGLYLRGALDAGAPAGATTLRPQTSHGGHPLPGTPAALDRLLGLIRASPHLDLARLLALIPPGALPRARALLLASLGRTDDALRAAALDAADDELAEEVADRAAAKAAADARPTDDPPPSSQSPHLALLALLLDRDASLPGPAALAAPARLLARRPRDVDPRSALDRVPDAAPLAVAAPFAAGALRAARQARAHASLVRGLAKAAGLAARADAAAAARGVVQVGADRACARCARRLGTAAFALLPGGGLAHHACMGRKEEEGGGGGGA